MRVRIPLVARGQRIGVLGGSFNPPHEGHLQISEIALRRLRLDRLWWLVTPGNPLKANGDLPTLDTRIAACRQFARDNRITVTGFEAQLGTPYTAATIEYLVGRYRDVHFVWLMGADNLAGFHRWQRWRDIARLVPIAVVDRPGWRLRAMAAPAARGLARYRIPEAKAALLPLMRPPAWTFLGGPLSPLSSTELRTRLLLKNDGATSR